jgi:hypothetical protein
MTSRMLGSPARIIVRRSMPGAIPPWGGTPYSNASSMWPKPLARHVRIEANELEDLFLQVAAVDPDGTAADFVVVQDQVILLPAARPGRCRAALVFHTGAVKR